MKRILIAAALTFTPNLSHAEEPIVGNWKTDVGDTTAIGHCGGGYCIVLKTGKHAGMQIGTFSGKDGSYEGKITDPDAKKTYSGSITATENAVKLKGCVMKVVCESQTWTRL
jgi:uncharacterized protein (DUF2147 family)